MQKEIIEHEDEVEVVDPKQTKITDWYNKLVDDCKQLQFEGLIRYYWNIGNRVKLDIDKFGKPEYGSKFITNLSKDLEVGEKSLYRAVQFANQYPQFSLIERNLKGKSWRYIYTELLPEHKNKEETNTPEFPEGKYQIIYADPAWKYWNGGWKNQEQYYTTMDLEEIKQLPLQNITDENCILFMWATFPYLKETIEVMESWGFKYSTLGFIWIKKTRTGKKPFHFGCGSWTRANVEPCIIGTKGTIKRQDASISQIIYEPIQEHSKKPDIVRDKIIQLVGNLPRIELFARQKVDGWDRWGNEI